MPNKYNFNKFLNTGIYVVFLICMIIALSNKCNYHVDELQTYALSNQNGSWSFNFQNGKKYVPAAAPFLNHMVVQPKHRFDYLNVWDNQAKDVHPPLYYSLVHTICSFFPKSFSPWYAGVINFIFALLTLFVLRKLSYYFLNNKFFVNLISIAFVLSPGILSSISFLRMYVMAMFWVTLLTYVYICKINDNELKNKNEFLFIVSVVTLLGSLTHYYCILYAVIISIMYGIYLLQRKEYKEILYFCSAMTAAGIISYLAFSAMIDHIFLSYRGKEVLNNAGDLSDFYLRLRSFFEIVDRQLFGTWGWLLGILLLVLLILYIKNKDNSLNRVTVNKQLILSYMFIVIPVFLYFLLVSKITVFREDRYMFPVYALLFWCLDLLLINLLNTVLSVKHTKIITVLMLCLFTISGWIRADWRYLYLSSKTYLKNAVRNANTDCICIYNTQWKSQILFAEAKNYKSIQFVNIKNKEYIDKVVKTNINSKKIILCFVDVPTKNHHQYIQYFIMNSSSRKSVKKIGSFSFTTSYVLR